MNNKLLLYRFAVLVTAMMCALGAAAIEAYANYTPSNTTLTFYYDTQRNSRPGTTYDLNSGSNDTGWDTDGTKSNVTRVVFDPSFANARPTTTYDWFYNMKNLETIQGIGYLNTSEVTNMNYMFLNCLRLTSLDVSHFNTSKVISMAQTFSYCTGLTSLDLSSFNTSNVNIMNYMFNGCTNLRTIYVGEGWSTAAVTSSNYMFSGCTSLVGGQGTTYDANHIDKTYAHIDGGPSNPGYFTEWKEAYACYTPSNTTLTFYYDNQRSSRTGTTYDLNTGSDDTGWDTDGTKSNVTRVVFDPSFANARPTTTYDWFYNMKNLETIQGIGYLNTSEVTNMNYMFLNCLRLTSLDVSHFNTSKVISMAQTFSYCTGLTSLDLSSFNTSNVNIMNYMFNGCTNLQTIYVGEGWSTAAVTSSNYMFSGCTSLVGGQGTTWNSSNPTDKTYAHIDGGPSNPGYFTEWKEAYACYTPSNTTLTFYYDNQRSSRTGTTYDLNTGSDDTGWDTDGTKSNVTRVVFDPSFANARPTTTYDWFYNMKNLETIQGIGYLNTSEVTNMNYMFLNCLRLTSLDVSHFNTSKVISMAQTFSYCTGLTSLDLSSFNTSNVNIMNYMFNGCTNLQTIYVGEGWSTAAVTSSNYMFSGCTSLVGGQGTTWNSSNPTDKTYAHIDGGPSNPGYFTEWKEAYACYTPSNTTLTFYYDNQRSSRTGTTYDLNTDAHDTGWDTDGTKSNVTKVVFDPSFAGARPTTTYDWFYGMQNLESITGMSYLNTSEVTNMAHMFNSCSKLTSIDLSGFNTSKVTEMRVMFCNCTGLTSLDLSSFNTSNVTNMFNMFGGCSSLRTICVGNGWSTAAVSTSTNMFYNCTSLVGGQGTTYNDSNPKDKTYAHIDGGPSNPGYFTAKNAGLRGDADGDGEVSISDVSKLTDYLLTGNASGVNLAGADADQDGEVAIADVSAIIDYLLSGNW